MKTRFVLLGVIAALSAVPAPAGPAYTCTRTDMGDGGFRVDCSPPQPIAVPAVPVIPTVPTVPVPPTPPASVCPPNINPMICSMLGYGQPQAGPAAGLPPGESTDDPTFVYRCGSIRRIYGAAGGKKLLVTRDGRIAFAIGESGQNETSQWHISMTRNEASIIEMDFDGVYYVTPETAVHAGDLVGIAVFSRVPGRRISVSLRLSVDGC